MRVEVMKEGQLGESLILVILVALDSLVEQPGQQNLQLIVEQALQKLNPEQALRIAHHLNDVILLISSRR